MKKYKPYLFLFILLQACLASFCQEAKMVALTKYTQTEGLSSYYVTKIIKDSYGFMWIGTQEGLNLFDGRSFRIFSKQSAPSNRLGGSFVMDLVEDNTRNLLWVLTSYGDICAIDLTTRVIRKRIHADRDGKSFTGKWVRSIMIQNNLLWIGGLNVLSVFNISENKFVQTDVLKNTEMSTGECNVSKLFTDPAGRLWVFSDGFGIVVLDQNLVRVQSFQSDLSYGLPGSRKLRFWDITYNQQRLYAATSWGIRIFETGNSSITRVNLPFHTIIDTSEVFSLAFSSPHQLFFASPNSLYSQDLTSGQTIKYCDNEIDDDWLTLTYQVFYDTFAHKLWVGTQSGLGSFKSSQTPFTVYNRSPQLGTRIKHAFSLLPVSSNEVYCGDENGVFYVRTNTNLIEKIDEGSSNLLLFKDKKDNIFLSNNSGLYNIKDKKLSPARKRFPSLAKLETDHFNCALQFNDSIILFGSVIQKGLSAWNTQNGTVKTYHNDSSQHFVRDLSIINNLYKNNKGETFILTEKSILRFDPLTGASHAFQFTDNLSGKSYANYMDMCETTEGYWIATYGDGIILTDKNFKTIKSITVKEGLSNNCIYKVFPYKNKSIIATTNNGLTIINCMDLTTLKFYESDGLHSSFFEQVCGMEYEGKIYAGGVNGFTIIDPDMLYSNSDPPLFYFDRIALQTRENTIDSTNIFINHFFIPDNILQVTISFSGLNYKNPFRTVYAYKIAEDKGNWIELGTQNLITLPALPPGKYTLLFRSANEAGVWNENPTTLELIYLPKWYQTLGFKVVVALLALAFIYILYRFRLSQIKKQQQIRKNIASDLHDDIGGTLNAVKVFTHLAKKEPQQLQHLDLAEESLSQVTLGLRDIIWVLDDTQDSLLDLVERIKKSALPLTTAKDILLQCTISGDSVGKSISKTEKRNLLLIAKEAINNSIKYAECKNIWVYLHQQKKSTRLTIQDDGKGFDINIPVEGNGLKNMQYRASQILYKFRLVSNAEKGTMIEVEK